MNREYIIVCNGDRPVFANVFTGALMFWGHKTEDNEKRSFDTYTSDIDKCEMYTLQEIKSKYHFPVYKKGMSFYDFSNLIKFNDVIIKKTDLLMFDELKTMKIIYIP